MQMRPMRGRPAHDMSALKTPQGAVFPSGRKVRNERCEPHQPSDDREGGAPVLPRSSMTVIGPPSGSTGDIAPRAKPTAVIV